MPKTHCPLTKIISSFLLTVFCLNIFNSPPVKAAAVISANVTKTFPFAEPAGCSLSAPKSSNEMLTKLQADLGTNYNLEERRQFYIWNGEAGTMVNVTADNLVFEFSFYNANYPLTYQEDRSATIFLVNGFIPYFRAYGDKTRILAIPLVDGVLDSSWGNYVRAYWDGQDTWPNDDKILKVIKKLPCHWMIEKGYAETSKLQQMFDFNWQIPDYTAAGQKYLATDRATAQKITEEKIHYWDVLSSCGPLTWSIIKDANGFPYRFGNWTPNADAFTRAQPRKNHRPWSYFDPETYDLIHSDIALPNFHFEKYGNLYPGDIVFAFGQKSYDENSNEFNHLFVVTKIREDGYRMGISNLVKEYKRGASISEIPLYKPGVYDEGFINREWNGFGYGKTGMTGFEVLRWKWVQYHVDGKPISYQVRWGDTLETIGFDWKVSPQEIQKINNFSPEQQLLPGQNIQLPKPDTF